MPSQIKFKIGDITTAVEWQAGQFEFDIPPAYRPFSANTRADITLTLHLDTPELALGEKFFDSPPIWSLYRNGGASAIKIFDSHAGLKRLLVLPARFQRADLYFSKPGGQYLDPFFGPTMELLMINYLARGQGVIVHACAIEYEGSGLLFAGESGAGKSTLANLWNIEKGASVLSDDRTLVRDIDGELRMYGTPWHGEARFGSARGVKLGKIFFLSHGRSNSTLSLLRTETVLQLLQCAFAPLWDVEGMDYTLEFFERLATRISCHELTFRPDDTAIDYIKQSMV